MIYLGSCSPYSQIGSLINPQTPISNPRAFTSHSLFSSSSYFFLLAFSWCNKAMGMAAESQFHVLAVDDSLVDRKWIEKLLKTSSFQGMFIRRLNFFLFPPIILFLGFWLLIFCGFFWTVTVVDSVSKALEFLGLQEAEQERKVNLIITDYSMPGMTGYDLLRKIKVSSFA